MNPELLLLQMRFQLAIARANCDLLDGDARIGSLKEAGACMAAFEQAIAPPPQERWILRHRENGQYVVGNPKANTYGLGSKEDPSLLYWDTSENATAFARHANLWKVLEPVSFHR